MLVRLLMQAGKACSREKWAGAWCDGFSSVHPLPACSMELRQQHLHWSQSIDEVRAVYHDAQQIFQNCTSW
jgi:hypothetical protein